MNAQLCILQGPYCLHECVVVSVPEAYHTCLVYYLLGWKLNILPVVCAVRNWSLLACSKRIRRRCVEMTLSGVCQSFSRRRAADFSTFDA